jgi:hypothetical protein
VDPFTTTQLKALDKSRIKYERIISLAAGLLSVNLAGRHSDVSCSPSPIFRGNEYNPKGHRQVRKPAHCRATTQAELSAEVTPICQPPVYIADMPCRPLLGSASWMLWSDCLKRVLKSLPLHTAIQIYGFLVLFSFSRAQAAIVIIFHRSGDDYQPYVHETTALAASQLHASDNLSIFRTSGTDIGDASQDPGPRFTSVYMTRWCGDGFANCCGVLSAVSTKPVRCGKNGGHKSNKTEGKESESVACPATQKQAPHVPCDVRQ